MESGRIILAAITGPHGVGGEVRLKLFAESVESVARHEWLQAGDRRLRLKNVRGAGPGAIARFEGIGDRSAAEALRGLLLSVDRSELPPLEEGEYYLADLIGLACVDRDGTPLGQVVAVENFGAGDLLEVERPDGRRALVPFRPGIAEQRGTTIIIDPLFLV